MTRRIATLAVLLPAGLLLASCAEEPYDTGSPYGYEYGPYTDGVYYGGWGGYFGGYPGWHHGWDHGGWNGGRHGFAGRGGFRGHGLGGHSFARGGGHGFGGGGHGSAGGHR